MSKEYCMEAVPLEKLECILSEHRRRGEKIVFTNGVFDLIHQGHVRYMRAAKSRGDVLVVALNTDDSVRRLKGEKRPILPQTERVKIIASLEMVNYVTLFDDDTPQRIIERLAPDVLVKGSDYAVHEIVGRDTVESYGGVVEPLPLVHGVSTSGIVKRILDLAGKSSKTE